MRFLRAFSAEPLPVIRAERVHLRPPVMADHPAWVRLRRASRDFLAPWEPIWPADDLERGAFRRRLRRYARQIGEDTAYPFFLFRNDDDTLIGGITLAQVRRGVAQAATLGYWMGAPHAGRGHMSEAVGAVTGFAFDTLRLHRVEAACLPENVPSIRLLERVGFRREGEARAYLEIAGRWRDHILWGMVAGDPLFPAGKSARTAADGGFPG